MGKPFKKELSFINETYNWAKSVDITELTDNIEEIMNFSTFVVGSGGSFSACHMFSVLQQSKGTFSKPITPLELHYSSGSIRDSNVFFLSASGKNSDILFAYNRAIMHDAKNVFGICMKKNTRLRTISLNHSISKIIELDSPAGKDGFLATNSLIGYFTLLSRMFGFENNVEDFYLSTSEIDSIKHFVEKLDSDFTLIVLYAGWSQPVAVDLESKFTEAGLGNVLFSDYRNFGHGRHNWFDKKKRQSAVVALITPEENELAQKTLALLPDPIPKLVLETRYHLSTSTIDLLIKSFYLVNAVGEKVGIDPGRPGVPTYGGKLYNLRYLSLLENKKRDYKSINAILRKSRKKSYEELTKVELTHWNESLFKFKKKMNNGKFGAVILDYDGTLCTKEERKKLPSPQIIEALHTYAKKGFIVGIVTGRGKSVRANLAKCIDKKYWGNIIVGYYNGGVIAQLTDESQPDISAKPKKSLQLISDTIRSHSQFDFSSELSLRPLQMTIEKNNKGDWNLEKQMILEMIANLQLNDIQVLESGHSMDVIARPEVSKLNIIKLCVEECSKRGISEQYVCIGDKGMYPGNDYELLRSEYSLSVDEVSSDPVTCWNLSDVGKKGVLSCLEYLNSAKFNKSYFTLSL
ncbi:HAD hydrolase family protein [Agriterribacter sp.]|uniref:HAD hydrolase family protein n=1 Tax=Agriterribacter sp. TaxID=2821509 RepID=UPI002CE028D2|nr:HAD hydrolase family protein [Agriterribacter sp.]HTN07595.1 HAD hydrolase family protein [Agriterribacter sp.]